LIPAWQSLGAEITPAIASWTLRVERCAPVITAIETDWTAAGLTVSVTGFANTRELREARFRFEDGTEISVPVAAAFAQWMADPTAAAFGSQFKLLVTFANVPPSAGPVSVVLVNAEGMSAAAQGAEPE
jgi:hypothetical protein